MTQTTGTGRHTAALGGLRAVLCIALLALLHAAFSAGSAHVGALDTDHCGRQGISSVAAAAYDFDHCGLVHPVAVAADGLGQHHGGETGTSCAASACQPRTGAVVHKAASDAAAEVSARAMAPPVRGAAPMDGAGSQGPSASALRTVVLRC
ncbi:MAG: hypothetical protein QOF84_4642 [Streptomyces sp.]|jgi:hypothetical protein|nr:hypothetical protein [Streptomyces sp.]